MCCWRQCCSAATLALEAYVNVEFVVLHVLGLHTAASLAAQNLKYCHVILMGGSVHLADYIAGATC